MSKILITKPIRTRPCVGPPQSSCPEGPARGPSGKSCQATARLSYLLGPINLSPLK